MKAYVLKHLSKFLAKTSATYKNSLKIYFENHKGRTLYCIFYLKLQKLWMLHFCFKLDDRCMFSIGCPERRCLCNKYS